MLKSSQRTMKKSHPHWLKNNLMRASKVHLFFAFAYIVQLIAYDASKLITPQVVRNRWIATAVLTGVIAAVYYLSRTRSSSTAQYKFLAWLLILADIAFASYNVYTQRGMASRAVVLFIIPIILSAILMSRAAIIATTVLCTAVYTATSVAYFTNYFNEGYKIELYGEILFYSATFFICAGLLWTFVRAKHSQKV